MASMENDKKKFSVEELRKSLDTQNKALKKILKRLSKKDNTDNKNN